MNALQVQCVICGAKPGWKCLPAPNTPDGRAGRRMTRPHGLRVEDAEKLTQLAEGADAAGSTPVVGVLVSASPDLLDRLLDAGREVELELSAGELIAEHTGRVSS